MNAPIGAESEACAQCVRGLGWAHRHRDHLAAHTLLQLGSLGNGPRVERIEEEWHTLAAQSLCLRIEVDRVAARDLFDEADDLHLWEPNQRCSPSSTTSTATWLPSTRS